MRASAIVWILVPLFAGGCGGGDYTRTCAEIADCLQGGVSGQCLASPTSASRWCAFPDTSCAAGQRFGLIAGDGLKNACVGADDTDGGVLADAGTVDGSLVVDAGVDAGPPRVPVTNGQAADLVLGQANFVDVDQNGGAPAPSFRVLNFPSGLSAWGNKLLVLDGLNARVLQWSSPPIADMVPADLVLGQISATAVQSGPTQILMSTYPVTGPGPSVFNDGTRVYAADAWNHRVLVWNPSPPASGTPASVVLGQTTFTTSTQGNGAGNLSEPLGVWSDGTRLLVADSRNNRVLIWNSVPTSNGQPANVVLGQASFGVGAATDPPTASSMGAPYDVDVVDGRLYVTDARNNRIMVWNSVPTTNNAPADFFIGQSGPTQKLPNAGGAGTNAAGLSFPTALTISGGSLFISDSSNHRVVVFTPVPTSSGASASAVLGQDALNVGTFSTTPSATRMNTPASVAVLGNKLFVSDTIWCRILRFDLRP